MGTGVDTTPGHGNEPRRGDALALGGLRSWSWSMEPALHPVTGFSLARNQGGGGPGPPGTAGIARHRAAGPAPVQRAARRETRPVVAELGNNRPSSDGYGRGADVGVVPAGLIGDGCCSEYRRFQGDRRWKANGARDMESEDPVPAKRGAGAGSSARTVAISGGSSFITGLFADCR